MNDVESPDSYSLKLSLKEAQELIGNGNNYNKLVAMLDMDDGEIVLVDPRERDDRALESAPERPQRATYDPTSTGTFIGKSAKTSDSKAARSNGFEDWPSRRPQGALVPQIEQEEHEEEYTKSEEKSEARKILDEEEEDEEYEDEENQFEDDGEIKGSRVAEKGDSEDEEGKSEEGANYEEENEENGENKEENPAEDENKREIGYQDKENEAENNESVVGDKENEAKYEKNAAEKESDAENYEDENEEGQNNEEVESNPEESEENKDDPVEDAEKASVNIDLSIAAEIHVSATVHKDALPATIELSAEEPKPDSDNEA
jgi:hypothetical protein